MNFVTPIRTFYLPSGRVIVSKTRDGYLIESTEMRDVNVDGKSNEVVRESNDPKVIWQHLAPVKSKWLCTVSTQKGCMHNCKFCDVAPLKFCGNLTLDEIKAQIRLLVKSTPEVFYNGTSKAKIGFARMGEPSHNLDNVLSAMTWMKDHWSNINWLPCFNSILPQKCQNGLTGFQVLKRVLEYKESVYDGFLHLQISCNSTDELTRQKLFGDTKVIPIKNIISIVNSMPVTNRTVTLNFISMQGVELSVEKLLSYGLNPEKFAVKVIPLNKTNNASSNSLNTVYNYSNYDQLLKFKERLQYEGIPIVVDAIARCEEAGLCCGQIVQNYM